MGKNMTSSVERDKEHEEKDPPSAATSIVVHPHYQMPTQYRIHLIITISQHDTGSTITILISDSRSTIIIHDVAAAEALDPQTIRQRDSGEEVKDFRDDKQRRVHTGDTVKRL
ncbi:unnamed protein product [Pleuronectes platessa]|uniref:Uncharacterized protein n=1 Tax=Pleuronectes platessa TaxID=8262 RepID=A0A9N7U3S7_PLEPL|nr:unnamed protein product [Pleuronectes platessa]